MSMGINQYVTLTFNGIKSVDGDTLNTLSTGFSTTLKPMRASVIQVRQLAAAYLEEITDDIINLLILKYSIEAEITALCDTSAFLKWDYYASKWIVYKVVVDCILNSPNYISETKGKIYKKLGDFAYSTTIDGNSAGPVGSYIKKMECEAFKLMTSIRNCREPSLDCTSSLVDTYTPSPAQTMIKGESNPGRPSFGRSIISTSSYPAITGYIKLYDRIAMSNPYKIPQAKDDRF